ncbi:unnamed protein product [Protopolystoma xenopodis]|uniref:Secretory carrier-associated membrane protein n=1 Tax=Protopolystoma xenopodis TaxID=117903 RepID=A0A3S5A8H2_9PLAT|nr:unnamed protein product [Protopolystoma xenopodis]
MSGYTQLSNPFADPASVSYGEPPPYSAGFTPAASFTAVTVKSEGLDNYNPFENKVTSTLSSSEPNMTPLNDTGSPASQDIRKITNEELEKRQRELDARAAELQRREEEQRRLDERARAGDYNGAKKNWPPLPSFLPCRPCFYQNIEIEISEEYQKVVRMGYFLWMCYAGLLLINVFGSIFYFAGTQKPDGGSVFGVALLTAILFAPLSYVCWFRPLYKAFRSDSSFNFFVFFFVFFAQVIVMVIQSLGITSLGACGWIVGLAAVREVGWVGAIVLAIAALFTSIAVVSGFFLVHIKITHDIVIQGTLFFKIHRIYRATGASLDKARQEFVSGMSSNPAVIQAATSAFISGPTSNTDANLRY